MGVLLCTKNYILVKKAEDFYQIRGFLSILEKIHNTDFLLALAIAKLIKKVYNNICIVR